jgi:hypothetical protein
MQPQQKLTLIWLLLILAGVVLALFFGIGWLFLALTIRRALMIVPPLRRWVRERYLALPPEDPVEKGSPQQLMRALGYLTICFLSTPINPSFCLQFSSLKDCSTRSSSASLIPLKQRA